MKGVPLTVQSLRRGVSVLCRQDPDLSAIVERHGPPPLWARRPGFATLVRIVLEQQVSLASGRAVYERLRGTVGRVVPGRIAEVGEAHLRRSGLTRQKARYCHELAVRVLDGRLDLRRLGRRDDEAVRRSLLEVPGIGPWTADVYLLMAMRRPDIWPTGDLALAVAAQEVKRLRRRPDDTRLAGIADGWRPWRAVAARILWHGYLKTR